ncbi:MAG TPA: transcriptional activator NhaR [Candidatus Krumholzibacteria bacterium]|nr:transcriptional activator NhaR [Candidatus Krumholzibacteria bacterium]
MEWLNYHHLFYFWKVVRAGSITRASRELHLAPSTISAQMRMLEEQLGEKLLARQGRTVAPTDVGRMVVRYAEEIFGIGRELMDAVKQRPTGRPLRLVIGVDDVLPKDVAYHLIKPALRLPEPVRILCREASLERLLADLAVHEIDLVLSDALVTPTVNVRAYNHFLGECGVMFVGTPNLAKLYRRSFPKSLDGAPILLPTDDTAIRRSLDQWLEAQNVRPVLIGEFEDLALMRVFGQAGVGIFPVPSVVEKHFEKQFHLERVGLAHEVRTRFYAISTEKKLKHPAVVAICDTARQTLFRSFNTRSRSTTRSRSNRMKSKDSRR